MIYCWLARLLVSYNSKLLESGSGYNPLLFKVTIIYLQKMALYINILIFMLNYYMAIK